MAKLQIIFSKEKCIGNGQCEVAAPNFFKLNGEKADLANSREEGDESIFEGEIEDYEKVIRAAENCPVNAIKVVNLETSEELVKTEIDEEQTKEIVAEYDDMAEFTLDPQGYFLIRVNKENQTIEVGFCNMKNNVVLKVVGKKPIDIYHTIFVKQGLELRREHCAYLGRELQKAFIALQKGIEYVQDDELEL